MIEQVTETSEYQRLLAELRANARVISISGLVAGAARALAVAALQRDTGKTFAVVSQTTRDLEPWERDLHFWYCALHGKESATGDILVLPAGRPHPEATELLASDRMSTIMDELAARYRDRIVLLDSPPLLMTSEAQALASQVGQVAVVVESGATSHQMLRHALEVLDPSKAINLILNKTRHTLGGSHYRYYGGEYDHYARDTRS